MPIKLNIGKPVKPAKSLKDTLNNINNKEKANLAELVKSMPEKPSFNPVIESPILEVTTEKYSLLAEASDILNQKTIDQFNQRMRLLSSAFDNDKLHEAMQRVMEYCQEHQELRPFLRAEDISIFAKGARKSYAKVAEKKIANRTKKSKSVQLDEAMMDLLGDIELDL